MNINDYIIGQDRNEPNAVAHLYKGTFSNPGMPMCVLGGKRVGGEGYSVFRNVQTGPQCMVCLRRATEGRDPVPARPRKTKWL